MEKFNKRCPYCGKIMERGEIPRGEGESPHDIKWIPERKKGKWYEELLYFLSQEGEDKVIELTSKYYPTIWDEKKHSLSLQRVQNNNNRYLTVRRIYIRQLTTGIIYHIFIRLL